MWSDSLSLLLVGVVVYFFIWRNDELDIWVKQIGLFLYTSALVGIVLPIFSGFNELQGLFNAFWLLVNNQLAVFFSLIFGLLVLLVLVIFWPSFLLNSCFVVILSGVSLLFVLASFLYMLYFIENDWGSSFLDVMLNKDVVQNFFYWAGPFYQFQQISLDGLSLSFILLTILLILCCVFVSYEIITRSHYGKEYLFYFLLLGLQLTLLFSVTDLLLFYILFESTLIPMFLLIGVWGSRRRRIRAAYLLFFYTFCGSFWLLVAIFYLYAVFGTFDILVLYRLVDVERFQWLFETEIGACLWMAFFVAFAIKIPMVPFHIWLPEAHVEASTAGSVILAGLLLKLGAFGFVRFLLCLFKTWTMYFSPLVSIFCLLAIVYVGLTTVRQVDLKRIIAYSSIGHMNLAVLGLFTLTTYGISGSLFLLLSHGLVSSALFLMIGVLYDRYGSRLVKYYGRLADLMPLFSIFFFFFTLANMSFPGTSSFVGEFLILAGIGQSNFVLLLIVCVGLFVNTIYAIWLANRLLFIECKSVYFTVFVDLTERELLVFTVLAAMVLYYGIYPYNILVLLNSFSASVVF